MKHTLLIITMLAVFTSAQEKVEVRIDTSEPVVKIYVRVPGVEILDMCADFDRRLESRDLYGIWFAPVKSRMGDPLHDGDFWLIGATWQNKFERPVTSLPKVLQNVKGVDALKVKSAYCFPSGQQGNPRELLLHTVSLEDAKIIESYLKK